MGHTEAQEIKFLDSKTDDELKVMFPGLTAQGLALIRMGVWVPPGGYLITDEDIAGVEG